MLGNTFIAVFLTTLLVACKGVPYSKYGRSCKDIGCLPSEVCVMAEDACNSYQRDNCGLYPTCKKNNLAGETCQSKSCPPGTYCMTENGRPTCVKKTDGLAPAARKPPGYDRPYAQPYPNKPVQPYPTRPTQPRPTPPTPPPRNSPFDNNRNSGYSGHHNTIGKGSLWDRLFGGGGSSSSGSNRSKPSSSGGFGTHDFDRPTSKPATNYYPGGKGYYDTHTNTDSKGNKVWTFSG